jgi:hypothetical protein
MKKQHGVTLTGLIMFSFILVFVALLGFKLFTPYSQYFTLVKTFKVLAANPEVRTGSRGQAMGVWSRYAQIDNITAIDGNDIEITKDGNDVVLSASYSVKVPLFANINLLIDFNPTSSSQ